MKSSRFDWQIPPGTCLLLVDDSLDNLDILMDYIEQSQWPLTVLRAQGAPKALEILRRRSVQLIVSDWDMPEMNGLEFLRELQADAQLVNIPVIMCTGVMTTAGNLETALLKGAVDYLRKPVDAVEFLARLRSSLELADTQQRLRALNQTKDEMFVQISEALAESVGLTRLALEMADGLWQSEPDRARAFFVQGLHKSQQGQQILSHLLGWSRYRFASWPVSREAVALRPVFESLRSRYEKTFARQELCVRLRCNSQIQVLAEYELLTELLAGLMSLLCDRNFEQEVVLRAVSQPPYIRIDVSTNVSTNVSDKVNNSTGAPYTLPREAELGLRVCQELAHLLGTRLQATGSEFTLLLPLLSPSAAEPQPG